MVKICKIIIYKFLIIFFIGCGTTSTSIKDEISEEYNNGIELYNNKKYSKSKDSFKYVILHSTGSRLALESEYYLAESLYNLKEYREALYSYDNYARSSQNLQLIEHSRFRLCQCAYELSANYKNDQTTTIDALEKIEVFLEDYSNSKYYENILSLKKALRYQLAKKEYESARLYMKLGEYKSALIYLLDVLNDYNDLEIIADDVRLAIIFSYVLDGNHDLAMNFYKVHINNFNDIEKKEEAILLIDSTKEGIKTTEYLRLFK